MIPILKYYVLFWVYYITYNTIYFYVISKNYVFYFIPNFAYYFCLLIVFIAVHKCVELLFNKKAYFSLFLVVASFLFGYGIMLLLLFYPKIYSDSIQPIKLTDFFLYIKYYTLDFVDIAIYATMFSVLFQNIKFLEKLKYNLFTANQLEVENNSLLSNKTEAINSLNDIYNLSLTEAEPISKDIYNLKSLLDYYLNNKFEKQISLEKEIYAINTYINLNKSRFKKIIKTDLYFPIEVANYYVPHMALLTLVENAFKHGNLFEEPLVLKLTAIDGNISFFLKNKVATTEIKSTYVGLNNLKRRLELLLQNKFTLNTYIEEQYYFAELKIYK